MLYTLYTVCYVYIFTITYYTTREAWGYDVPTADLQLCRDFKKCRAMDIFTYANLGESFESKKIVFRRDKDMSKDEWWFAQTHMKDSSLICWPVRQKNFRAGGKKQFLTLSLWRTTPRSNWSPSGALRMMAPCTGRVTITQIPPKQNLNRQSESKQKQTAKN